MMDNELAALVISLQQQVIDLQQQLITTQDELTAVRHQCLTFYFALERFQSANYEFSGIIDKIRQQNNDTTFKVTSGEKSNRYIIDARHFQKYEIVEGMAIRVTANVLRIISRRTPHQLDGFVYYLPAETIQKI